MSTSDPLPASIRAEMYGGMFLVDYFAGLAMSAIISGTIQTHPVSAEAANLIATMSYTCAYAMCAERMKWMPAGEQQR